MFVPPDHWQPGPPPRHPAPPRRALTKRGEAVMLSLVCFFLLLMLVAPIGGSTVVEMLRFLLRRWGVPI